MSVTGVSIANRSQISAEPLTPIKPKVSTEPFMPIEPKPNPEPLTPIKPLISPEPFVHIGSNSSTPAIFKDFQNLAGALQSGNSAQAQQALGALNQAIPSNASGPLITALGAIDQALQANNLPGAQQALRQITPVVQKLFDAVEQHVVGAHHLQVREGSTAGITAQRDGIGTPAGSGQDTVDALNVIA